MEWRHYDANLRVVQGDRKHERTSASIPSFPLAVNRVLPPPRGARAGSLDARRGSSCDRRSKRSGGTQGMVRQQRGPGGSGIKVARSFAEVPKDVRITGAIVQGNRSYGVIVEAGNSIALEGAVISGNGIHGVLVRDVVLDGQAPEVSRTSHVQVTSLISIIVTSRYTMGSPGPRPRRPRERGTRSVTQGGNASRSTSRPTRPSRGLSRSRDLALGRGPQEERDGLAELVARGDEEHRRTAASGGMSSSPTSPLAGRR